MRACVRACVCACVSSRKHGSTTGATKPRSPSSLPAAIQHVRFPAAPAVVASLSFSETHFPLMTFKTKFDFDHSSFELIQVSVTLQTSALHLMCMYRPPPSRKNKLTDSLFSEQFPDLIDTCNSLRGQICILGDMNIHYDCPDHPLTSKTLDLLYMYNFKQVATQSTHRRGHILDCIIIRSSDQIHLSSEVTDSLESDHLCVMSCFDVSVARSCPVYRYVRNIRGIDRSAFVADLETELVVIGHSLSADQYNVTLLGKSLHRRRRVVSRSFPCLTNTPLPLRVE